ncbi:hypothetical protein [Leptothoe sp. PORK10 BA2]|uniref:hypothetical protein n=1 Tax=Leptothoe sp. PORK10 BA2 TaxID=3110254 RepID=UPI002B2149BB|nr:hypothetical protein [Leptothoe sp. PORK10 BA2]MEA5463798.1 hypothetical protein [Leptothoe sp. PORK10 BA2]
MSNNTHRKSEMHPFPFDIAAQHKLEFTSKSALQKTLPKLLDAKLQRFNLAS